MTTLEGRFEPESGHLSTLIRWGVAGSLVIALHGAAAYALLNHTPPEAPPAGAPEAAILIDLAPPVEAEAAPPPPEVTLPEPVAEPPPPEPVAEPPLPEPVPPEPVPEPPEPVPPEPVPPEPLPEPVPPEPVVEPLPEPEPPPPEEVIEKPLPEPPVVEEVAPVPGNVPLPMMRPTPPRPPEPRAEPRRAERVERAEPRRQRAEPPPPRQQRRQAAQPPASAAARGVPQRQASQGAPVSASANARWQSRVLARLNRFARNPPGSGTVSVSFVVDSSGGVSSVRVTRSGGAALDEAALVLVRRASPFPAPPSGQATTVNVPIRFNLR